MALFRPGFPARWLRSRRGRLDLLAAAAVAVVVIIEWCANFRIFQDQRITDPVSYFGDAEITAALVAAAARGDFLPFASKMIPSLGAPFVASWNDFPISEDWLFFLTGQAARLFGTFGAINLGYLTCCVLSGLSFFFVARRLHRAREFALMGAMLFGLSMYAFARGVHHYTLVSFWFLPGSALVATWAGSREGIPLRSGRFKFAFVTFVIVGWSSPYYLFFTFQLFALCFLGHLARRGRKAHLGAAAALLATGALAFLSVNWDTINYARINGRNDAAVSRGAQDGDLFGLKPINFFIAGGNHRLDFMNELSAKRNSVSIGTGEAPSPYLGYAGVLLLLGLVVHAAMAVGKRRLDYGVACALVVAWFTIAHSVGGASSFFSIAGMFLFRSLNRASIVIFIFVLLFGAWVLPRWLRRVPRTARWVGAALVGVLGAWEAIPIAGNAASVATDRARAESDRKLVAQAEAALPPGAKVFQLPPMHFPEVPNYGGVDGYELFRPYFFAKSLVFSHGDVKGRPNADWKFRVAALPAPQMVQELKTNGFSAIYINTKGYGGAMQGMLDAFAQSGAQLIGVAEYQNDSLFLRL